MGGLWCLLLVLLLGSAAHAASPASSAMKDTLRQLRDAQLSRTGGKDGVIRFNDDMFSKVGAIPDRDFSLIVFLDARQLRDKAPLALLKLRKEFALVQTALSGSSDPEQAFLVDVVFEDSPLIFKALNMFMLPYIFRVDPSMKLKLRLGLTVAKADRMGSDSVPGPYPWTAEMIAAFFQESRAGVQQLQLAPVDRPSIYKSPFFPLMVAGAVLGAASILYGLWRTVARHPAFWAVGAVIVAWFSTSGGMYNIIRGVPLFLRNSQGRMQLFVGGKSEQLGAEGFIVGSGYVLFSLLVALFTHGAPKMKHAPSRSGLSCLVVMLCAFVAAQLWKVYVGKTSYTLPTYLGS